MPQSDSVMPPYHEKDTLLTDNENPCLTEKALSKAIGRTHLLYAQCMQRSLGCSGHFWQGRYYSCPLDDAHAHNAAAYIELNPVRAGMVKKAWEYTWSSAVVHALGREDRSGLLDTKRWFESMSVSEWQMTLEAIANSEEITNEIRKSTCTGRPLGDNVFLKYVEANIEHPLPVSRGRPKKNNNC